MKGKLSDAGGSFIMEENHQWEGVLWNPPAKLQMEREGPGYDTILQRHKIHETNSV